MPPQVPAGLPSSLLERRPDIRQAEQELIAANAEIGAARAEYFPRISLTGFLGVQSRSLSEPRSAAAPALWSAGLGAAAPIFNAGRTRANVALRRSGPARSWSCATSARSTSRCAKSPTRSPAIARPPISAPSRNSWSRRSRRRRGCRPQRYEGGVDNYLQVLDAQRNLFQGELDLARLRQQELASIVQLYRALGGGWSHRTRSAGRAAQATSGAAHRNVRHERGIPMVKRMILMLASDGRRDRRGSRRRQVPADPGGGGAGRRVAAAAGGRHDDRGARPRSGPTRSTGDRHGRGGAGRDGQRRPARARRAHRLRVGPGRAAGRRARASSTRGRSRRSSPPRRRSASWRGSTSSACRRSSTDGADLAGRLRSAAAEQQVGRREGRRDPGAPSSARRSARRSPASSASARSTSGST